MQRALCARALRGSKGEGGDSEGGGEEASTGTAEAVASGLSSGCDDEVVVNADLPLAADAPTGELLAYVEKIGFAALALEGQAQRAQKPRDSSNSSRKR